MRCALRSAGVSAAVGARYTEAFYGTDRDEGARLKHVERLKVADQRERKQQQAQRAHQRAAAAAPSPPPPPPPPPRRYAATAEPTAKAKHMVFV